MEQHIGLHLSSCLLRLWAGLKRHDNYLQVYIKVWKRKMSKELEKKIEQLDKKVDKLQLTIDELNVKLSKHIGFIDETYEGLKNPINAARRFLGR